VITTPRSKRDEAIRSFERSLDLNPHNGPAHEGLAEAYQGVKRYEEAIEECELAIELEPDGEGAYATLGELYMTQGLVDEAVSVYERLLERDRGKIGALVMLSNHYTEIGEAARGKDLAIRALDLNARSPMANYALANACWMEGDIEQARGLYETCIRVGPAFHWGHLSLGILHMLEGDNSAALASLEMALEINGASAYVHNFIGLVYQQMEMWEEATEHYEAAVLLDPDMIDLYQHLCFAYETLDTPEADRLGLLQRAGVDSTSAGGCMVLSGLYHSKGMPEEALSFARRAAEIDSLSAGPHQWLGYLYAEMDMSEEAREEMGKTLDMTGMEATGEQQAGYLRRSQVSKGMVIFLQILVFVLAISVHESAHAWAADRLGDPTAREAGRLTLNPIPHISIVGTIILPIILIASHAGVVFGWAKPVPINPENFEDPKRGIMLSSLTGPVSNLLLALVFAIAFRVAEASVAHGAVQVLFLMGVYINLILCVFNLIPVPPLDGSGVVVGILPPGLVGPYLKIRRFGFILIIVLFYSGVLDRVFGRVIEFANLLVG
jgi:Zn-dependent protease/tetratricopeptide (TPR) repeat protein